LIALLLGPNGQLGSDIQKANQSSAKPLELVPISRARLDIEDLEACSNALGSLDFDVLINCSSYHKTDEVEAHAQRAVTVNAHAVQRMAEICAQKKARFVHISTDYVFGGYPRNTPFGEEDAKAPVNVYGATKAMGEDLALLACDNVVIARVASLFGVAGASGKGGNFVETMLNFGREKGQVSVVADQYMSPTSTADAAEIILRALKNQVPSGIYHVVNSGSASWWEFAARIFERCRANVECKPIATSEFLTKAKRPRYSVLSNLKIAKSLDITPHNWQVALDNYLAAKGYR
jgi:dTDP-4-dehydrorhamnose reductase